MPVGRNVILSVLATVILLSACNGGGPWVDIIQYFGRTEPEIKEMLGEPSWRERDSLTTKAATICYHLDEKPLPPPLREVKFLFSDEGLCFQVLGITRDCDTPEEVLAIIGLGNFEKERASQDELGFSYRMPPFELAQVHRPSSIKRYSNFCLLDRDVRDKK